MTAEIAIMNKEAIALAADSAVTMGGEKEQKVFTSANKLFCLSRSQPVGIMVHGSAYLMGVPWETIVKDYRKKLGERTFKRLKQYAGDFMAFLGRARRLFPAPEQDKYLARAVRSYFGLMRQEIVKKVESAIKQQKGITEGQVEQITSDVVVEHYKACEKAERLPSLTETDAADIRNKYRRVILKAKEEVFEKLPIPKAAATQLVGIAVDLFCRDIFPDVVSGVVVAGFGEDETFPSLKSFTVEAVLNCKVKYREEERLSAEISFKTTATIVPFAQSEMVATFMEGVDPDYRMVTDGWLDELFEKYPDVIAENIHGVSEQDRTKLKQVSAEMLKHHVARMTAYRRRKYVDPVTEVVSMLPKDDLAAMAETLISLTSFKRKLTPQAETVGGPIDVAVITKGDGFIWIKRKHYFRPELNVRFLAKCFREAAHEER